MILEAQVFDKFMGFTLLKVNVLCVHKIFQADVNGLIYLELWIPRIVPAMINDICIAKVGQSVYLKR